MADFAFGFTAVSFLKYCSDLLVGILHIIKTISRLNLDRQADSVYRPISRRRSPIDEQVHVTFRDPRQALQGHVSTGGRPTITEL